MSEKMTRIDLPGQRDWPGLMDYGERDDMIAQARLHSAHLRKQADNIDAAADSDFKIDIVRGIHVQHHVRNIQPGRSPTHES